MSRTKVDTFGRYGSTVNVFADTLDGEPVARAEWRENGRRRTETFHGTKRDRESAAKAFAEGTVLRLQGHTAPKPQRRTVGELWAAYVTANETSWRPKTLRLARQRWSVFTNFLSGDTFADLVMPETLDSWRVALLTNHTRRGEPMARNQVAHHIQLVKAVWRHARQRKLIPENVLADYAVKKGRDYKPLEVPEFTGEEWGKLLNALSPRRALHWRAWVAIALDGLLATRSSALLALRWDDIDMHTRTVVWPALTDKVGNVRKQSLPRDAVAALRVAKVWARRDGYTGPFVFYSPHQRTRGKPWTYSALNAALHAAGGRAGVARVQFKAMHSFRRMSANNVLSITGDITKVGKWLGDSDVRVLQNSYLRNRPEDMAAVVATAALPKRDKTGNETATAPTKGRRYKNAKR
jgi:integrase